MTGHSVFCSNVDNDSMHYSKAAIDSIMARFLTDRQKCKADSTNELRHLGWRLWKKWSGYHRRSLVETTMLRFKLLGDRLAARQPERQVAEVHVRCAILNTFNRQEMPVTVPHD